MNAAGVLLFLLDAAIRAAALASIAALLLTLRRHTPAATRLRTWRLVLWVLLALPAIGGFAPPIPWRLPAAPLANASAVIGERTQQASADTTATRSSERSVARPASAVPSAAPLPGSGLSWSMAALVIYLAGVLFLLMQSAIGWRLAWRLEASATAVTDPAVLQLAESRWARLGRGTHPRLAASSAAWVPMTLGILRPVVLLPGHWRDWSHDKLTIVLIHELAHVARRDALTQRLSLLYRAVFWFSPVSWWLRRHLVQLGEQASDEAVLAAGTDPAAYAETLLQFFAAMGRQARRAAWHVGMARRGSPESRIETILNWKAGLDMQPTRSLVAGFVLAIMPATALIAAVRPVPVGIPTVTAPASRVSAPPPGEGQRPIPVPPPPTPGPAGPADRSGGPQAARGAGAATRAPYQSQLATGATATPDEVKSFALQKRLGSLFTKELQVTPLFRSRRRSLPDPRNLHEDRQEVICGLTVVRQSADIDPRIIIPRNRTFVPAVRRIEPDACRPGDEGRK